MPKRRGRNEDPVGKHAKAAKVAKAKATKEAKAADKAADKQRREADADAAKEKVAAMEVDESFTQMQEDKQRIRRQSDMKIMTHTDDSDGQFPGLNDVELSDKESEAAADEIEQLRKKRGPKVSFDSDLISKCKYLLLHPERYNGAAKAARSDCSEERQHQRQERSRWE